MRDEFMAQCMSASIHIVPWGRFMEMSHPQLMQRYMRTMRQHHLRDFVSGTFMLTERTTRE